MKQTIQMKKIQDRMKPGVITLTGFLGTDTRNLIDIILEDDAEVKRLGLTHAKIASRMLELRDAGMRGLGDFINVPPHFEIRVDSVRGKLPCPFGDPGVFPKTNITVRNLEKSNKITYTDLNIHLILAHGFYQGKGSLFGIEIKKLVDILEIEPEESPLLPEIGG